MYYNTTNVRDKERAFYMNQAKTQDEFILQLFKQHDYQHLTPTQVLNMCEGYGKNWPITSIRRSLNTLSNSNSIIKLPTTSLSMYGRPEHRYKLA